MTGKGGFKLSLRSEDPEADRVAIVREMAGRRINILQPGQSLILAKGSGQVSHEGGSRIGVSSPEYALLRDWIAAGCPGDAPSSPTVTQLEVTPRSIVLPAPADRFRVRAIAYFSDGSKRDVTGLTTYDFTASGIAKITPTAEVIREQTGETVLLARYLGHVAPVRVVFLPDRPAVDLRGFPATTEIDRLVRNQFRELRLEPAALTADHVFVRRAFLDATGLLPTAAEAKAFLADHRADKRDRLIDDLIARPAFAQFWAQKWADLLRTEEKALDRKGVTVFYQWIASRISADQPMTEFARELLTATGSTYANPATNFWRAVREPTERAEAVAQVFLGVRVACARCHNHPFDRWTSSEYYGFSSLFARIDYRVGENRKRDTLDVHEFVGEQVVFQRREGEVLDPRTQLPAKPRFLGSTPLELSPEGDRLAALADWMIDPANPFFARAQVNRVWLHLNGRGLVDPNDDFRATNPPSNPELLDWLAADFKNRGYRLKPLVRTIMRSRAYQLSATAHDPASRDDCHNSHAIARPITAEQLLDAVVQVLEVPVRFNGYPLGLRANQLPSPPQTNRRGGDGVGERFLRVFGKPDRLLTCECERIDDPGLIQAFQLITGELLDTLLRTPDNRIGKLLASSAKDEAILEEFYLSALSRLPTATETEVLSARLARAADRRAEWEDIVWGLINSKEFHLRR